MDIAQDGNLFPREDILEAVAQSDWRDQAVPMGAWGLTALGLSVLALGTPTLAPLAMEPTEFAAAGERLWAHPLHGLARVLGRAGLGIESAWYLISALFLGLSLPALGGALRVLGIGARLALVVSLVTLLAPITLAHGQLPSDFTAGVFGASIVLGLCCAPSDPGHAGSRGYGVRLGVSLLVATMLHPLNAALIPALVLAARSRGGARALAPLLVASALAAALGIDVLRTSAGPVFPPMLGASLLAFGGLFVLSGLAWSVEKEESPPPLWLTVQWVSAGVLSVVMAYLGGPMLPMLGVASAALAGAVLARFARPDNAFRALGVALVAQLILLGALNLWQPSMGTAGLSKAQPSLFQSGDTVYAADSELGSPAAYIIRRRFGVQVLPLAGSGSEAPKPGGGRAISLGPQPSATPWFLDPETGTIHGHE